MCLCNNEYPVARVNFDDTILLGLEIQTPDGVEHVCGYYNKVVAAAAPTPDFGWNVGAPRTAGDFGWHVTPPTIKAGNAMLIAIPAIPGSVNASNLVAVSRTPHILEDYKTAVAQPEGGLLLGGSRAAMSFSKGIVPTVVKGFDGGTYDVVIAPTATSIATVLSQVDAAKRPTLNEDLYAKLDLLYPGFTFVLFCFAESDSAKAGCAVVKYKPMPAWSHLLYLPGLDGHNGSVETGEVELSHTLAVGSYRMQRGAGQHVDFSDGDVNNKIFLNQVIGRVIEKGTVAPQGDFLFLLDDVIRGELRAKRQLPPGWNKVFGSKGVTQQPYFIR